MNLPTRHPPTWTTAWLAWLGGTAAAVWWCLLTLTDRAVHAQLISDGLWNDIVHFVGGTWRVGTVELPAGRVALAVVIASGLLWVIGAGWKRVRGAAGWGTALRSAGGGWLGGAAMLGWLLLWHFRWLDASPNTDEILLMLFPFATALCAAYWLSRFVEAPETAAAVAMPGDGRSRDSLRIPLVLFAGVAAFVATYTWMNWELYFGLRLPHGDSAMYEEHLWNLTHGKGFRSYLDQGLFLGEHIQVIHVLLLPLYLLWPSQLLLELCEAIALGAAAIPVYWIALRHSGSRGAALCLGFAALLYFPLHFLEISIDLKTFRPICFGVPLLLFAIDRIERKRFLSAGILLLLTLSAKEDYAAVLAPLGVWMMWHFGRVERNQAGFRFGTGLMLFSLTYVLLAVTVIIPAFREGADVHFARYFGDLGNSPGDILLAMFDRPGDVLAKIFSRRTALYGLALLVPLGGIPLLSPGRLFVGLPLFGVLSLMQLSAETGTAATDVLIPFHHFHAPLVPILFWSAAASAGRFCDRGFRPARFALCAAICSGLWFSNSPAGIAFWDPHSSNYWKALYIPGERAEKFKLVIAEIPPEARVASTDFVHPRFTHYARSYDYSRYPRKVSGYELRVPDDTDYIVIDTKHPYSWIHSPADVPELRDSPKEWELLPDKTDGYFIVLKRNSSRGGDGGGR